MSNPVDTRLQREVIVEVPCAVSPEFSFERSRRSRDRILTEAGQCPASRIGSMFPRIAMGSGFGQLQGWKEISDALGVGVRTAQRWEREAALPVRRLGHLGRGPVYAIAAELLDWQASRSPAPARTAKPTSETPAPTPGIALRPGWIQRVGWIPRALMSRLLTLF